MFCFEGMGGGVFGTGLIYTSQKGSITCNLGNDAGLTVFFPGDGASLDATGGSSENS